MPRIERIRELATDPLTLNLEHLRQRAEAGWKLTAVEWTREVEDEVPVVDDNPFAEDVPYGLRVSADCQRLEPDPEESRVLMKMMELMVEDRPLSRVAAELNERGFRTRRGQHWTPGTVFDMLPRLIEVGPRLFASDEWETRRKHFTRAV